jgi:Transposase DDE domain
MDRELLLIALYCMVDDTLAQPRFAVQLHRPGRKPKLPDVALLTLALFQEFSGIHKEDDYWAYAAREFADDFPGQLVDRSQYHRRKKNLAALINQLRRLVAATFPNPANLHVIDCLGTIAITTTKFFGSHSFPSAGIGFCASKRLYYAGYKTATIVSPYGVIEDFVTGTAEPHDAPYGEALLETEGVGTYLGDKGFIFRPEVRAELEALGVYLTTPQRCNMRQTNTEQQRQFLKRYRPTVETVNGQLTEHFSFDRPGGKSERGLLSRLLYKLAAHTFGLAILRQFNLPLMRMDLLTGLV